MKTSLVILPSWTPDTCPLGISYISSVLKEENYDVKVHDYNVQLWNIFKNEPPDDLWGSNNYHKWQWKDLFYTDTLPKLKPHLDECAEELIRENPDVIGFSIFDTSLLCSKYVAEVVKTKKPSVKIIFGGSGAYVNNLREDIESGLIDFGVYGEGETTMLNLMKHLKSGEGSPLEMTGLLVKGVDGKIVKNPPTPNLDMKELPMPDFSEYDLTLYKDRRLPLMMSRGCVAQCSFCGEVRFWYKFRMRPAEHILKEFEHSYKQYNINHFAVNDSLINGNMRVLGELVDLMIKRKNSRGTGFARRSSKEFRWGGYSRVDKRLTPEFLKRLREAGCEHLSFGVESGSQRVLDLMKKNATVEEAYRTMSETGKAGINVILNIIIGYPNESFIDFLKTVKMIYDNRNYIAVVCTGETLGIHPDTPLYDYPEKFGIKANPNGGPLYDEHLNWVSIDGKSYDGLRKRRLMMFRWFLNIADQKWSPSGLNRPRFSAKTFANTVINPFRKFGLSVLGFYLQFRIGKVQPVATT